MSKGGSQTQTTQTRLDPDTERYMRDVYEQARRAGNQEYSGYYGQTVAPADPAAAESMARWRQMANLGMTGMSALGGDQAAMQTFMNPYLQTMNPIFDQMREASMTAVNDAATRAGAFGGSRTGVATGQALSDIANQQTQMNYGAFGDAMQRAGQVTNMGLGANNALFMGGDYLRNIQQQRNDDAYRRFLERRDWGVRNLDVMRSAMGGPYGTDTRTRTPTRRNVGASVLGGAATGAAIGSVIPGIGTAIGAGIGGLIGLF